MSPLPRDREKLGRMEQAVRVLIQGLGEDLEREGLRDTPKRVAKALLDCTQGYYQDTSSTLGTALFHEPIVHQGDEGIVVVRDIDFASTSEETLLPFHGRCHVAYRPKDGVVLGLSKLARLTKQYSKRLQTQERLAAEIALALQQSLECHGVAVVLRARHLSNSAAPEERINACVSGVFAEKASSQLEELLSLLHLEDLPAAAVHNLDRSPRPATLAHVSATGATGGDPGVPAPGTPDPSEKDTDGDSDDLLLESSCCCDEMEAAMQQLLLELGENPHRPGLAGSARRYVMSLLASTSGYHIQQQQQQPQHQGSQPHVQAQPGPQQGRLQHSGLACSGQGEGVCVVPHGQQLSEAAEAEQSYAPGSDNVTAGASGTERAGCSDHCQTAHVGLADTGRGKQAGSGCSDTPKSCCDGGDSEARTRATVGAAGGGCWAHGSCCARLAPGRGPASHEALSQVVAPESGPLHGAVTLCLPFASQCEHHMLPFYGQLMVSYFPPRAAPGALEPPPLPRAAVEQVVCMYTQRLQVQERITHQVADAIEGMLRGLEAGTTAAKGSGTPQACSGEPLVSGETAQVGRSGACVNEDAEVEPAPGTEAGGAEASGVMVVCDAAHMCMVARGVENHSGSTTTYAVRGVFATRSELRRSALQLFREQHTSSKP